LEKNTTEPNNRSHKLLISSGATEEWRLLPRPGLFVD